MMKLPKDRAIRNAVTSARCPACHRFGARLAKTETVHDAPPLDARAHGGDGEAARREAAGPTRTLAHVWCSWCAHHWTVTPGQSTAR